MGKDNFQENPEALTKAKELLAAGTVVVSLGDKLMETLNKDEFKASYGALGNKITEAQASYKAATNGMVDFLSYNVETAKKELDKFAEIHEKA